MTGSTRWTSYTVRIPESLAEEYPANVLSEGDLVINMTAQSLDDRFLGRVCRAHDRAFLNQRIGRLVPQERRFLDDLYIYLRTSSFADWVARRSEGSKVKHMHWRHIEDYPVPWPQEALRDETRAMELRWLFLENALTDELRALTTFGEAIRTSMTEVAA